MNLMAEGPYGIAIHNGAQSSPDKEAMRYRPQHCYSLWTIVSGQAQLQLGAETRVLSLPAALLLPPRAGCVLNLTPGSAWTTLRFDVIQVPRLRGQSRSTWIHRQPADQPPPHTVWGCEPPWQIPTHMLEATQATLAFCAALWWRDDMGYARANARLGAWLIEYVAATRDQDWMSGDDWVAQVRRLMHERLELGLGISEVAQALGMSRQHFSNRYRSACGEPPAETLRRMRYERAASLLSMGASVAEAARGCGFRSVASFSHGFQGRFGLAPSQWRQSDMRK